MKILFISVLFVIMFGSAYSQPLSDATGLVHRLDIEAKGQTYEVQVVGNFDVSDYEFDKEDKRLTVMIQSPLENNLGEMIIPIELMSGNFTFNLDDMEFFPNNRQSEKISFVSMTFNGTGQHKLDVVSSEVLVSDSLICFPGLEPIDGECPSIPSFENNSLEEINEIWEEKRQQCNDDYPEPDSLAKCLHLVDTWHTMQLDTLQSKQNQGGGCLIATAAYGSELSIPVQQLRELRAEIVRTQVGSDFMESFNAFYYSFSPGIADYERQNPVFKEAVKLSITPMIASLSILNGVDLDSEEKVLGYGISMIMLNIGMYGIVPASIVIGIRKLQK